VKYVSVYRRARSPFWWIVYWSPERQKRISQATPYRWDSIQGKRKALDLANELGKAASADKGAQGRDRWECWVSDFLEQRYPTPARKKTYDRMLGGWKQWRQFLIDQHIAVPRALTYQLVLDFIAWRSSQVKPSSGKVVTKNTALCDVRIMSVIMREAMRREFSEGKVLQLGTVSTNIYLRRLHNFCLDMNWLPWPLIPKRQWPAIRFKEKRAITWDEHCQIVVREKNPERKAFYQLAWHLGASQSDLAHLQAEDVDWSARIICFVRMKTRWRNQQPPQIRFGQEVEAILGTLPKSGPLFPNLQNVKPEHRATEFRQRCLGLGIRGVTLHSYRYAWAERAKVAGYPERFAQLALGHNSKAVHRAYARKAQVTLPPLEDYEKNMAAAAIIPLPCAAAG
jgi:integrase